MKVVLVVDWLDSYAGAERVIKSLNDIYHFEDVYTISNTMDKEYLNLMFDENVRIHTSMLQVFGKHFRKVLILFPFAIRNMKIDKEIDLVISSSHSIAKGINTSNVPHISYLQARNMKYIWEEKELYFKGVLRYFKFIIPYLRNQDIKFANNPDFLISNSKFVANWVKKKYKRLDSPVIYPPVEVKKFDLVINKEDYYVTVGRIEPYKRFDLIVNAFKKINRKLIIIGDGSSLDELKRESTDNIIFKGFLEANEIARIIGKAKAFIFAGKEDFGIAPLEAQSCGTPVIGYKAGGLLETIVENETGIFFKNQTVDDIVKSIDLFESKKFNPEQIRKNAERFSKERFEKEFKEFVEQKIKEL